MHKTAYPKSPPTENDSLKTPISPATTSKTKKTDNASSPRRNKQDLSSQILRRKFIGRTKASFFVNYYRIRMGPVCKISNHVKKTLLETLSSFSKEFRKLKKERNEDFDFYQKVAKASRNIAVKGNSQKTQKIQKTQKNKKSPKTLKTLKMEKIGETEKNEKNNYLQVNGKVAQLRVKPSKCYARNVLADLSSDEDNENVPRNLRRQKKFKQLPKMESFRESLTAMKGLKDLKDVSIIESQVTAVSEGSEIEVGESDRTIKLICLNLENELGNTSIDDGITFL